MIRELKEAWCSFYSFLDTTVPAFIRAHNHQGAEAVIIFFAFIGVVAFTMFILFLVWA